MFPSVKVYLGSLKPVLAATLGLACWPSLAAAGVMPATAQAGFASQPLRFEANRGQCNAPESTQFLARTRDSLFALSATEAVVTFTSTDRAMPGSHAALEERLHSKVTGTKSIRLEFIHASPSARISGADELGGKVNYFVGSDPAQWQASVPLFSKVEVKDIYPGINLVYYGNQQQVEYDFVVGPGSDPASIAFRVSGADAIKVDERGDLVLQLGEDQFRQHHLVAYQLIDGARKEVEARYRVKQRTVTFELGHYERNVPLVIDPVLSYSALFGGSGTDAGYELALDGSGNIYVVGETLSPNLPVTTNAYQMTYKGGLPGALGDAFIAKFDNSGSNLLYLTYLGGNGDDVALGVAVDSDGAAYVTGVTDSTNFPLMQALYTQIGGIATNFHGQVTNFALFPWDAFVTKLDPSGSSLSFSTYLGGDTQDEGLGIGLDSSRNIYVTGFTDSTNFPILNAPAGFDHAFGLSDVFVTRINAAGTAVDYSLRFGGTNDDHAGGLAVAPDGTVYITGWTASTNFPVTPGAFQTNLAGFRDAFFTVISPSGSVVSSTFFGGVSEDFGFQLALDPAGNAYVTGSEEGAGFPISPSKLNPGGMFISMDAAVNWSASNSGLYYNVINSLAVDPGNPANVYVGTWRGVSGSSDGGQTWHPVLNRIAQVPGLVVDPLSSSRVFAGVSSNVFTLTFSNTWSVTSTGLVNQFINKLTLSPAAPTTLYASTEFGVFRSTNSALTWTGINTDLTEKSVRDVAVDPLDPSHLYAATADGVFFSTNAGARWVKFKTGISGAALFSHTLSVDPATPSTVYVATEGGVFKSTNSGTNWTAINSGLSNSNVLALAMDPGNPSILYAGTTNGIFKTINAGSNWTAFSTGLELSNITVIAVDPANHSKIYAGTRGKDTFGATDAFLARFGTEPTFMVFGGNNLDEAWDVAVDGSGNAYVVGDTFSTNFFTTTNNLTWPLSTTNGGGRDVFVAAINLDSSTYLYSAYLGGTNSDLGLAIQADAAGNAYIVGETASKNFPTRNTTRTTFGGTNDVFLAKISMNATPTLLSSRIGGQVVLRWLAFAPGYVLQSATNLGSAAVWQNVTTSPPVVNGYYTVTLDATNAAAFFRLKK